MSILIGDEWKEIPGHEGYYANRDGRIGSAWARIKNHDGPGHAGWEISDQIQRVLKPAFGSRGNFHVTLAGNRCRAIHCLILETFVGPCPEGMEARHLNWNTRDNRLENLAWAKHSDMIKSGFDSGKFTRLFGKDNSFGKLTSDQIREIRELRSKGGLTHREIGERFGVTGPHVSRIVNRKVRSTHKDEQ
jgi:hypothetical protein